MIVKELYSYSVKCALYVAFVFLFSFALVSCSKDDDNLNSLDDLNKAPNTVVIDGVTKPILRAEISRHYFVKGSYRIRLILSKNGEEYLHIDASKKTHEGKTVQLSQLEDEHNGFYLSLLYRSENGKVFESFANPKKVEEYVVFKSGTMYLKYLNGGETSNRKFEIKLDGGVIEDSKNGDKKEHTISLHFRGLVMFK